MAVSTAEGRMTLLDLLRRDRFDESEGSAEERAYKRGWNHHADHTERLLGPLLLSSSDDGNTVTPAVRDSSDGLGAIEKDPRDCGKSG